MWEQKQLMHHKAFKNSIVKNFQRVESRNFIKRILEGEALNSPKCVKNCLKIPIKNSKIWILKNWMEELCTVFDPLRKKYEICCPWTTVGETFCRKCEQRDRQTDRWTLDHVLCHDISLWLDELKKNQQFVRTNYNPYVQTIICVYKPSIFSCP